MVCAPLRLEFEVECLDQHQEAASALCVGGAVGFAFRDNRLQCLAAAESGLPAEEEGSARVPRERLEQLVASEEVQAQLRDERLQVLITEVDGAGDREKALQHALLNPDFKAFSDKVLAVIAPEA
ncbi:hypothetical protein WJX81_003441 [Elliptochloris bilobata]|uniref:Zinc finger HIT domain-containing protein n=1 Tax=Elliptochloris bilobata TaxID=381761 RepID=A0AAW1RDZ4_9CHLO